MTLTGSALSAAAVAAAAGFVLVAAFQVALAAGAPFGEAAYGGRNPGRLPARLRRVSAVAIVVWLAAALVVLARVGQGPVDVPAGLARVVTWGLVGVMALASVVNAASPSRWERFLWAPLSLALAVLCLVIARS